jgi:multiple antibiotic resistance protein
VSAWSAQFLQAFIPLFVAIDPIGLAAIFLALGRGLSPLQRRRVALQATLTGGGVALLFLFLGASIFAALGISVHDFQVAGGLILFLLAARDLAHSGPDPLGMPLIAGPALIATLLVLAGSVGYGVTLTALAANLILVALAFTQGHRLDRLAGPTALRAISKLISMLLAAIAVAMVRQGLKG